MKKNMKTPWSHVKHIEKFLNSLADYEVIFRVFKAIFKIYSSTFSLFFGELEELELFLAFIRLYEEA